jgi:hypothetical protein
MMTWTDDYTKLIQTWLKGNQEAIAFIHTAFTIAHTCDDLTDRDKPVETATMQQAFWLALVELPRNRFYVEHFALLNGCLQTAFLNWQVANRLEEMHQPTATHVAFILRSSYTDLVTLCAWILGGTDWAVQVGMDSRLHASSEGFDLYQSRLTQEQRSLHIVGGG